MNDILEKIKIIPFPVEIVNDIFPRCHSLQDGIHDILLRKKMQGIILGICQSRHRSRQENAGIKTAAYRLAFQWKEVIHDIQRG